MNKANRGDRIPVELFQILKDFAVKVLHSICQQIGDPTVTAGLEKVSFHSNPKGKAMPEIFKVLHNCTPLTHQQSNAQNSPSQSSTVHEPRTSRCSSCIQKRQRNRDQIAIHWIIKKVREFHKNINFCFIVYAKVFLTVWITTNCGNFVKRWEYQTT